MLDSYGSEAMAYPGALSIKGELVGRTVFLTGASGFVGSVLLEQLLRLCQPRKVYVLMRGRRTQTAAERLDKILASRLFHQIRDDPQLLAKVQCVEGSLEGKSVAISDSDRATLVNSVHAIFHCGELPI